MDYISGFYPSHPAGYSQAPAPNTNQPLSVPSHMLQQPSGSMPALQQPTQHAPPSLPDVSDQPQPHVYTTIYSHVPVFEMVIRGIGVMRRRSDSWMNANQLLTIAGVDASQRSRIILSDIVGKVPYETVNDSNPRYEGTWVPFHIAKGLAEQYNIAPLIQPLLNIPPLQLGPSAPSNGAGLAPNASHTEAPGEASRKRSYSTTSAAAEGSAKKARLEPETTSFSLRPASKAHKVSGSIGDDPSRTEKHRQLLLQMFVNEAFAHQVATSTDLSTVFPPDLDPDTPIDDQLHTALHWASALARLPLAKALIKLGADVHRGNQMGETPLVRGVLVTNHHDLDSFPTLLELLAPSLRTVDHQGRTVLHHIALIAAVKGRSSSAKYYLQCVLEHVAQKEAGHFKELVDAQDHKGDTALNVAARVGSAGLVSMLLEVGADAHKPNKLGLRPVDFGVHLSESGTTLANLQEPISSTPDTANVSAPAPASTSIATATVTPTTEQKSTANNGTTLQQSQEVLDKLASVISELGSSFQTEVQTKTTALETTRVQLKSATRQLAELRDEIASWKAKNTSREQLERKVKNLERALADEQKFDWTGRTELDGSRSTLPNFSFVDPAAPPPSDNFVRASYDVSIPTTNNKTVEDLAQARIMMGWYRRVLGLLQQRVERANGSSVDLEDRYRKVLAAFCGLPEDKIDDLLEHLLAAIESDGANVDIGRVARFMNTVRGASVEQKPVAPQAEPPTS